MTEGAEPDAAPLFDWLSTSPPVAERSSLALALVSHLAEHERSGGFAGPLTPARLLVRARGDEVELVVKAHARGEPEVVAASPSELRYVPPEQADGAPWDAAANRYVAGLLLYRLFGGEHLYSGRGLRASWQAQREQAPPPFSQAAARELAPGVQSLCLHMLDPDPARRPASARSVARRLEALLDPSHATSTQRAESSCGRAKAARSRGKRPSSSWGSDRRDAKPGARSPRPPRPVPARRQRAIVGLWLVLFGMLGAAWAASPTSLGSARSGRSGGGDRNAVDGDAVQRPAIRPRTPLAHATRAEQCRDCHPRHVSEWSRSVMAHASTSPLFQALEMLIEEQVGKDSGCEHGAGILRRTDGTTACRDSVSGVTTTGAGGEHWCVNCHAPGESLTPTLPPWNATEPVSASRRPLKNLLSEAGLQGIGCGVCHQTVGPAGIGSRGEYEGNRVWLSPDTGRVFSSRPEESRGLLGIGNSGYFIEPSAFVTGDIAVDVVPGGAHRRPTARARDYLRSSEFCGACHDVRLFGSDVIGARQGEHFKRLRNAYSEWAEWSRDRAAAGRPAYSCQDCHMSSYPGRCVADAEPPAPSHGARSDARCPPGTRFVSEPPGRLPLGLVASSSPGLTAVHPHYFSGVDVPLAAEFPESFANAASVDALGLFVGAEQRRDVLLQSALRFELPRLRHASGRLEVDVEVENVGAGHRVPAGFSQERELWVELSVFDATGATVYRVGHVDAADRDLRDKIFLSVNTDEARRDARGRPLGVFGADVADGPDVPEWEPVGGDARSARRFRGRGLINFQNGFLRCVRCIGEIDALGRCRALPGQGAHRAARYVDGDYDLDSGRCESNLFGEAALFETYFPVGALDARRGVTKAPDAIIDTRSLAPDVPVRYTYVLGTAGFVPPFSVKARLLFRAFPPFLLRAFAEYERRQAARGLRPTGPLITERALERIEIVELGRARVSGS